MASYTIFIAKRFLRSGRSFTSSSSLITTCGVALGVAAVCLFLAAHNGFENEIRTRILGATAHITVFSQNESDGLMRDWQRVMKRCQEHPDAQGVSPFIYYKCGIQSRSTGDGVVVRGADLAPERATGALERSMIAGRYSFDSPPTSEKSRPAPGILLGVELADRLAAGVGDPIVLYSITDRSLSTSALPKKGFFRVSGVFRTGFNEYDAELAYIAIRDAQQLFNLDTAVTGVHVRLADLFAAEDVSRTLQESLGNSYDVAPWTELYGNLFTWVAMERLIIYLIFGLIIVVAAFSIVATLVMITLEKRAEIAILKTLGLTGAEIRRIFVFNGLTMGVVGVLLGWGVALAMAWAQNNFHILRLPADVYFISYLPFSPMPSDFLEIGAITLIVCFFAGLYPAGRAARATVVDTLRQ